MINIEEKNRRKRRRTEKRKAWKEKREKKEVVDKNEYDSDNMVILDNEDTELEAKAVQDYESLTLIRMNSIGKVELMLWLYKFYNLMQLSTV